MGSLMSGGVESKLNFSGEVSKGCDERSWLGLGIGRDGSHSFVPTLMTVHRTHLLFHLPRDRCWHSGFSSVPTRFLLLRHLTIHTWASQSPLSSVLKMQEAHVIKLSCTSWAWSALCRWVEQSPVFPARVSWQRAGELFPIWHKMPIHATTRKGRSSLKRVGM